MAMVSMGFAEIFLLMLMGAGPFGMPPGERDAALLNCPPENTLMYLEWATRGEGAVGAEGIEGLIADPEVVEFLTDVEKAILEAINSEMNNAPNEARIVFNELPELLKTLFKNAGCLYLYPGPAPNEDVPPSPEQIAARFRAALILSAAESDPDDTEERLLKLLKTIPNIEAPESLDKFRVPLPPEAGDIRITLHREGDYFIVAYGEGTLDTAITGLKGTSNGLRDTEAFQSAMKKVELERTGMLSWLDIENSLKLGVELAGEYQGPMVMNIAQMVGADKLGHAAASVGLKDGQVYQKSYVSTQGSTKGILALAAGRGITEADLAHIPGDSDLVIAFSMDLEKVYEEVRAIIQVAAPDVLDMVDQGEKELEQALNITVGDLLAAFGDVRTIHNSPSAGGMYLTSVVANLEVKDPEKAKKVFGALMKLLEAQLPGEMSTGRWRRSITLEKDEFMGTEMYFINTVGDDMPLAPTFCLTKSHVHIAMHPQTLKSHVRAQQLMASGELKSFNTVPLGDNGDVIAMSYVDATKAIELLYGAVPFISQIAMSEIQQNTGSSMTTFSIPSGRALIPYFSDAWGTVTRTEDGILSEGQGGSSNVLTGMLINVPMFAMMGLQTRARIQGAKEGFDVEVEAAPF